MECVGFKTSGERTAQGILKDSCLRCGKTEKAHDPPEPPRIKILFHGVFYEFANWQEARKRGFYLG